MPTRQTVLSLYRRLLRHADRLTITNQEYYADQVRSIFHAHKTTTDQAFVGKLVKVW